MSATSKCPKCYDEAMGCNTGEVDQNGYLDCLCGAADARVAMEKELGLTEAPQWARDKAWRAYSMGVVAAEARTVLDLSQLTGYEESCMEGGGVCEEKGGTFIKRAEVQALLAASAAPKVKP